MNRPDDFPHGGTVANKLRGDGLSGEQRIHGLLVLGQIAHRTGHVDSVRGVPLDWHVLGHDLGASRNYEVHVTEV